MGFLDAGSTFTWEEASISPVEFVRQHGILQFLAIYKKVKNRCRDSLRWGDEIEYTLIDRSEGTARLSVEGPRVLDELMADENEDSLFLWRPEYACWMVEGTPGQPYGAGGVVDVVAMEAAMRRRRLALQATLSPAVSIATIANFPRLGADGPRWLAAPNTPGGPVAQSIFTGDEVIHPHFRFATLTANIRQRRGSRVAIEVPLWIDRLTRLPLPLPSPLPPDTPELPPATIYMDSMAFGMGCSCLQCTFQCCNIEEARYFYDQLAVLSPIMLAFSAATPIFRGYLADWDVRWNVICNAVDDRTPEERGLEPLKKNKFVINKSRYASIDCYISQHPMFKEKYNDIPLVFDKECYEQLKEGGVDELLARHISHLFIRDPLVIYRDKLNIDNENHADHFENIQSTNWQTVRFKPPPPNSDIGWRVEFRPCEVQLTDFENAALCAFVVLVTRVLSAFDLNFYIPISKVDENMETAHKRGALLSEKFYFRKQVQGTSRCEHDDYDLFTVNEIMNGKTLPDGSRFKGLIELINIYLDTINIEKQARETIKRYLDFISKRASGELMTAASWMRKFVTEHPGYKEDSIVTEEINNDLMDACIKIGNGELHPPELLGTFTSNK